MGSFYCLLNEPLVEFIAESAAASKFLGNQRCKVITGGAAGGLLGLLTLSEHAITSEVQFEEDRLTLKRVVFLENQINRISIK